MQLVSSGVYGHKWNELGYCMRRNTSNVTFTRALKSWYSDKGYKKLIHKFDGETYYHSDN